MDEGLILSHLQMIEDAADSCRNAIEDGDLSDAGSELDDIEMYVQNLRMFVLEGDGEPAKPTKLKHKPKAKRKK